MEGETACGRCRNKLAYLRGILLRVTEDFAKCQSDYISHQGQLATFNAIIGFGRSGHCKNVTILTEAVNGRYAEIALIKSLMNDIDEKLHLVKIMKRCVDEVSKIAESCSGDCA
jgi:hypothetical protein